MESPTGQTRKLRKLRLPRNEASPFIGGTKEVDFSGRTELSDNWLCRGARSHEGMITPGRQKTPLFWKRLITRIFQIRHLAKIDRPDVGEPIGTTRFLSERGESFPRVRYQNRNRAHPRITGVR